MESVVSVEDHEKSQLMEDYLWVRELASDDFSLLSAFPNEILFELHRFFLHASFPSFHLLGRSFVVPNPANPYVVRIFRSTRHGEFYCMEYAQECRWCHKEFPCFGCLPDRRHRFCIATDMFKTGHKRRKASNPPFRMYRPDVPVPLLEQYPTREKGRGDFVLINGARFVYEKQISRVVELNEDNELLDPEQFWWEQLTEDVEGFFAMILE